MKKFLLIPVLSLCFAFTSANAADNIDTSSAPALVKSLTTDVLASVKADKSIQHGDINKITALVNTKVLPYTDFTRTTRLATGRAWNTATPQQQKQLVEQFKQLLIRTYAGALAQVGDQQIEYKPFRAAPDDKDVVVRTVVINQNQPIQLDYRLEKTPAGWRVYDINVLGAWLIQAYQQQFSEQISQHGIEGLIQFLTQRNEQLASGNASSH